MQPLWYGDRRDRVKWGALFVLAENFGLSPIVQVAFLRDNGERTRELLTSQHRTIIPEPVWSHFSDLRGIRRLGRKMGRTVVVLDDPLQQNGREKYVQRILGKIRRYDRPKLVFLDPDTGIQADNSATAKHVSTGDISKFWNALEPGDLLAVYQHASRGGDWKREKQDLLRKACNRSTVAAIWSPAVKDLAILWTTKGQSSQRQFLPSRRAAGQKP